jgi:hypothetical protein
VRCVVERPPHFAFAFVVVFAVYLFFGGHPSPQAEDLLLAFAVVVCRSHWHLGKPGFSLGLYPQQKKRGISPWGIFLFGP